MSPHQLLANGCFKLSFETISMGVGEMFLHGWNRLELAAPYGFNRFHSIPRSWEKKMGLCSKCSGFAPFRRCPELNEKHSGAKSQHGTSFKLGFGEFFYQMNTPRKFHAERLSQFSCRFVCPGNSQPRLRLHWAARERVFRLMGAPCRLA